jgi:enoyl-CoA hydratase
MNVACEIIDAVALVRLQRPEKLNALTAAMKAQLTEIFRGLDARRDVRCVVLTGAGRAFCAGTDVAELEGLDERGAHSLSIAGQEMCAAVEGCGAPVIAAVNGLAAGGGCELALACHLRVAAAEASFSLPEIKLGVMPGYGGTQRLRRATGRESALSLLLTGASVSAAEAHRVGLVSRMGTLDDALTLAREVAQLAPLALCACLQAVHKGLDKPLSEGLQIEAELFSRLFATSDAREGARAFLDKRKPVFRGV